MRKTKDYETIKVVSLKMVKENSVKYISSGEQITTKNQILNIVRPILQDSAIEKVIMIGVDTQNKPSVIHIQNGSVNQCSVYPQTIFKILLLSNCTNFFMIHNHPGNSLNASEGDWNITNVLLRASKLLDLNFLDHIIVNANLSDNISLRDSYRWDKNL